MKLWATALLFMGVAAHADSIKFECSLMNPPAQQGQERYVKFAFLGGSAVDFTIASPESDYVSPITGLSLRVADYASTSSSAVAAWRDADGADAVVVSFVYFGTWWGGHVHFSRAIDAPNLKFKKYEEMDLRCYER